MLAECDDGLARLVPADHTPDPGPVAIRTFFMALVSDLDLAAIRCGDGHHAGGYAAYGVLLAQRDRAKGISTFVKDCGVFLIRQQFTAVRSITQGALAVFCISRDG